MLRCLVLAGALALAACGPAEQAGETTVADAADEPAVAAPRTVTAPDGVRIHYDDQGAGNISVVFVHGWSCDRSYWDAQWDHFAAKYRVVRVDLAGHGESGDGRDDFTMSAFGADVAAVAQALDLRNIVLVGHSMGGPVILEAAGLLKDRLAAVVGVDTLRSVGNPATAQQLEARMARLDVDFVGDVRGIVTGMFVEQSDPKLRDHVVSDMSSAPPRVAKSAMVGLSSYESVPAIAALEVPFVLINSDYRPTDQAAIEAAAKHFQYIEMTGVGHFLMMEDPEAFNAHLESVFRSLSLN